MLLGAWPLGGKNSSLPAKSGKLRFFFLVGGYVIFLILGAAMFSAIEAPKMEDLSKAISTLRARFLKGNRCLDGIMPGNKSRNGYESLDDSNELNPIVNNEKVHDLAIINTELNGIYIKSEEKTDGLFDNSNGINPRQNKVQIRSPFRRKKENIWFLFYIILYGLYLVIGSLCFQAIETPVEQDVREYIRKTKLQFTQKYPQVKDDDLEDFLAEVVKANDRGISPLRNSSSELNWGFGQALFFSSTVVTTIGYGHVTPLSQTGKIFCMIYATIGIPLTLVLLSAIVERLLLPANWLLGVLNTKLGHLYQPFNIRLIHLFIIIFIVGVTFFAVPTAVFAYLEPSWGVLDAFYYCFISLTTIGLGDYIPGDGVTLENRSLYKICITCYLVCGLIAMMLALTVFYDIPQLNLGQLFTESGGESEKLRLSGNSAPCYSGPSGLYIPQRDEDVRRAVVRIRPHGDESPSPDEQPAAMHRDIRVP